MLQGNSYAAKSLGKRVQNLPVMRWEAIRTRVVLGALRMQLLAPAACSGSAAQGRSAIVVGVGAEAGVGGALCKRWAREGYHVGVVGRTREKVDAMAATINTSAVGGGSASAYTLTCLGEGKAFGTAVFDEAKTEVSVP